MLFEAVGLLWGHFASPGTTGSVLRHLGVVTTRGPFGSYWAEIGVVAERAAVGKRASHGESTVQPRMSVRPQLRKIRFKSAANLLLDCRSLYGSVVDLYLF